MTLTEHLAELRTRLIRSAICVAIGMAVSWFFIDEMMNAVIALAGKHEVIAIHATEKFSTYLRVAFLAGIGLSMPLIVYQIMAFVSPGLTRRERNYVVRALPFVTLLFVVGILFGYRFAVPAAVRFLLNFGDADIRTTPTFGTFVSFVTNMLLWVGVSFEMPAFIYILIKLNIVSAQRLAAWRRYAVVLVMLAAAVITPTPDPQTMLIVAVPMYLLYELGIILGRIW